VPAEDSTSLKAALDRLLKDDVLREKLGQAARQHAAANFSYEGMLDKMEAIYRQVRR
jgi:glycosyltransferase involved in cell wall biosynthesis